MTQTTSPVLFWIGIALFAAYIAVEVVVGPPGPLHVAMILVASVALVLLIVDRLKRPRDT